MSDEKMRAEFEAAAEDHFWLQELSGEYDAAEQQYLDETVQTAWEFWQLSREALVVELPDTVANTGTLISNAVIGYKKECRAAIEAAGIKVKP